MKLKNLLALCLLLGPCVTPAQESSTLRLHERGYLSRPGLDVLVFADIYPDGHQTGVTIIQHGTRVAANGDVRLEKSPGQWSAMPKAGERAVDKDSATISQQQRLVHRSRHACECNDDTRPGVDHHAPYSG